MPLIYLAPFSDVQVSNYLRSRYPRSFWQWLKRRASPKHQMARLLLRKLDSLEMRPMLLAYIEDLTELANDDNKTRVYDAFELMVNHWLRREERRHVGITESKLRAACIAVAWEMDKNVTRALSEEAIIRLAGGRGMAEQLSALDLGGRSLLNRTSSGSFRFAHFSLQEYLLAQDLLENSAARKESSVRPTSWFVRFLVEGLIKKSDNPEACVVHGLTLRMPTLTNAQWGFVTFDKCRFEPGSMTNSTFSSCRFRDTIIEGVDLSNSNFSNALFESQTDLSSSKLYGCSFKGADLRKVNWGNEEQQPLLKCTFDDKTKWPEGFDKVKVGATEVGAPKSYVGIDLYKPSTQQEDIRPYERYRGRS